MQYFIFESILLSWIIITFLINVYRVQHRNQNRPAYYYKRGDKLLRNKF